MDRSRQQEVADVLFADVLFNVCLKSLLSEMPELIRGGSVRVDTDDYNNFAQSGVTREEVSPFLSSSGPDGDYLSVHKVIDAQELKVTSTAGYTDGRDPRICGGIPIVRIRVEPK